jgi:hypothetical protein
MTQDLPPLSHSPAERFLQNKLMHKTGAFDTGSAILPAVLARKESLTADSDKHLAYPHEPHVTVDPSSTSRPPVPVSTGRLAKGNWQYRNTL